MSLTKLSLAGNNLVIPGQGELGHLHCKKRLAIFPSPAGMSLTILSLAWNNLFIPGQEEFG
jgi:hypothetical protein